jgi:hypothetical protein
VGPRTDSARCGIKVPAAGPNHTAEGYIQFVVGTAAVGSCNIRVNWLSFI